MKKVKQQIHKNMAFNQKHNKTMNFIFIQNGSTLAKLLKYVLFCGVFPLLFWFACNATKNKA